MPADVPSADEILALYRGLGAPEPLVAHVTAVRQVAAALAHAIARSGPAIDVPLVAAGALLHDIGRVRSHGLDHAVVGAALLREWGMPEPLCLIVERHIGAGIDAAEAASLGLPRKDFTPRTMEEKVVCHADNLVDGSRRQKVQEELDSLRGRGLETVARKMRLLHDELSRLAGRDLDEIA